MKKNTGTLFRMDRFGLGFIESAGVQYAFTFDKIENYHGQQPGEIGLYEGCTVQFTVAHDGISIVSVEPVLNPSGVRNK